jgi:hypothetical protein
MKQHIGPIYLILGLMAVSALTIGAGDPHPPSQPEQAAQVHDLLPSPLSFRAESNRDDSELSGRIIVLSSGNMDAELEAKVARALAIARARKAI